MEPAPSVAIAHDYLTQRGGAERVVLALARAFPQARIYTTLYDPDATYPEFADLDVVVSPLNRSARLRRDHRLALPLLAAASRTLRIEEDVVVASSSGWAHGFAASGQMVVYCHSPARWLYRIDDYAGHGGRGRPKRVAAAACRPFLVPWDRRAARRADRYLANSSVIQALVRATYGIEAEVLHPAPGMLPDGPVEPVPELADWARAGYHLVVSRLRPYKHVDEVLQAHAGLPGERVVVVGQGPDRDRLAALAPSNARICSGLTDAGLRWVYRHATLLVAPSLEDLGLTPLEAGGFGHPTVALRAGGYLDTVVDGVTGEFFAVPTAEAIREAVTRAGQRLWDRAAITAHAALFGEPRFRRRIREVVAEVGAGRDG